MQPQGLYTNQTLPSRSSWNLIMKVKVTQLCLTLCDPIDGSLLGSPVPGILQARTLEWAAISFSNAWKWKVKLKSLSRVWLFVTPWTAAHQAPPSMGFSRQEHWSGVPLPSPLHESEQCLPPYNSIKVRLTWVTKTYLKSLVQSLQTFSKKN